MMYHNQFPYIRLRRNRQSQFIRDLVTENRVTVKDLVYPIFIVEGSDRQEPIVSLPGQVRVSIDQLLYVAEKCLMAGIPAIALFPMIETDKEDPLALESCNPDGLVPRAVQALKQRFPELGVFTDVALDAYTMDGHDGISDDQGVVLNDVTNAVLIKQALCHAEAGADFVCPSDMMDGRIGAIRHAFEEADFKDTGIIAYSAKYASSFYGPFREATGANSNLGQFGKKTYQMNPANSNEAVHEVALDIAEGADIIMVKPGLPYLDVLQRIKSEFKKPTATYHVSGEYAMLKAASNNGWLNYDQAILETMLCFKRAGSDMIWSYAALEVAHLLKML
jgi:porphobilinogen synthase